MILISFSQAENKTGFSTGSNFSTIAIDGQVAVTCEGFNGSGQALYTCRDVTLDPGTYDRFVGPKISGAVKVELTATHQDKETITKTLTYDGVQGQTQDRVNLWLSSLFQKPLLARGVNKVTYVLFASAATGKGELARGTFDVNVQRGISRSCKPVSYNSADLNDCHSMYSICQRYFQEQNYCK